MQNIKLAIIGAGVMGEVILGGILDAGLFLPSELLLTAQRGDKLEKIKEKHGIEITTDNRLAAKFAEIILLAVKPADVPKVLKTMMTEGIKESALIISIAAGVSIEKISSLVGKNLPIVRVMTNTPCQIKMGMSVLSGSLNVTEEHFSLAKKIFSSIGETMILPEKYLDAVTGLSGSGPGFLFLIAETFIDAGVLQGLPRDVSRKLVLETMIGSSLLLKKSEKHPAPLKDMVTSPGGTTIAGIQVMEEYKVRAALLKVVETATKRASELGKLE